jgi:hypothetical protein
VSRKGFKKVLDDILHPPCRRARTPEEKERDEHREWRHSELFFFF